MVMDKQRANIYTIHLSLVFFPLSVIRNKLSSAHVHCGDIDALLLSVIIAASFDRK